MKEIFAGFEDSKLKGYCDTASTILNVHNKTEGHF
jgi:hypothetical protein